MASADYYLCDVCGRKTFYDANLQYSEFDGTPGPRNPFTQHAWPVGVGAMAVLCPTCAETHVISIAPKEKP
jgi:hypothetical protein